MCAIVDANAGSEVFGDAFSPAGQRFFEWINKGKGQLVADGKLLVELEKLTKFKEWSQKARLSGILRAENTVEVDVRTNEIRNSGMCRSDDPHVVALAQISGARLVFTNDKRLHRDLKNKNLIDNPRGKIYSTNDDDKSFTREHQGLLRMKNLCRPR